MDSNGDFLFLLKDLLFRELMLSLISQHYPETPVKSSPIYLKICKYSHLLCEENMSDPKNEVLSWKILKDSVFWLFNNLMLTLISPNDPIWLSSISSVRLLFVIISWLISSFFWESKFKDSEDLLGFLKLSFFPFVPGIKWFKSKFWEGRDPVEFFFRFFVILSLIRLFELSE